MFDKKKLIILGAIVIFFVIAGVVVYFWLGTGEDGSEIINANKGADIPGGGLPGGESGAVGGNEAGGEKREIDKEANDQVEAQNLAKFFVEMLGSYSSDAKFQNIIDLKPMMTTAMQSWADDFMIRNMDSLEYKDERVTTSVFKTEVLDYTQGHARILFKTRRELVNGNGTDVYNQDAVAEMVKSGDNWLVNKVEWQ